MTHLFYIFKKGGIFIDSKSGFQKEIYVLMPIVISSASISCHKKIWQWKSWVYKGSKMKSEAWKWSNSQRKSKVKKNKKVEMLFHSAVSCHI